MNERRRLGIGPWAAGRLLVFDLGFFKWQLFARIHQHRAFFVSRLRDDVNPVIVAENRRWRGATRKLVGRRLRDVKERLAREVVDVLVEVEFVRRSYLGRARRERAVYRVVGVRHGDAREHHWYVTNVPITILTPVEIATTYAARWEIELVFRELKTHVRLAQLASTRRVVVEALIYAALIGLAVSRAISRKLRLWSTLAGRSPSAASPTRSPPSPPSSPSRSAASRSRPSSAAAGMLSSQQRAPIRTSDAPR